MIKQLRFQHLKDIYLNQVKDISISFYWLLKLIKHYEILFLSHFTVVETI